MSALADKVAREHESRVERGIYQCSCGERAPFRFFDKYGDLGEWHRAHTNAVMEAAVREQVARDIRAQRERFDRDYLEEAAYDDAARIARGSADGR